MTEEDSTRKPHNYYDELTPAQLEEWASMEAHAAEVRRIEEIGKTVDMFESFQKQLEAGGFRFIPIPKVDPMPPLPRPRRRRRIGPSIEQVAVARGIIKVRVIQEASS